MPGGKLRVDALADGSMQLIGPAAIVASGTVCLEPDASPPPPWSSQQPVGLAGTFSQFSELPRQWQHGGW
ncbi:hypothetical protein GCM10010276_86810 [Streptomyces longisporus]|uniref:Uncharacterized protein n=1 Tax=Streptomyces longisporus TaxID=1948 RepID=A0ABN3NHH5_STRLO